jgi:hypothetical protein
VEARAFHGPVTRLHLLIDREGDAVRVSADVPSRLAGVVADGATVAIRVDPSHVRSFPLEG